MLAKIFIYEKAYEVNLLSAQEVIDEIRSELSSDSIKELTKQNELENVISQSIDEYEKIQYKDKEYFIHKSDLPLEFKNKTYSKKYVSSDEMVGRFFGSIFLPVAFLFSNILGFSRNIINMLSASTGSTKIHTKYTGSEAFFYALFILAMNAVFYVGFFTLVNKEIISWWSIIGVQILNMYLGMNKPFNFQYNKIENYKLAPYTFDTKYDEVAVNAIDKLKAMKVSVDKKKIDFDFSDGKENKEKDKEKNYATY